MSASLQAADPPGNGVDPGRGADPATEAAARRLGWKDRGEFRNGEPADWVDAAAFLEKNHDAVPLLQRSNDRLTAKLTKMEQANEDMRAMLAQVSEGSRRAEERAYKRARAELEAERTKAVETGDTAAFKRSDDELRALEAEAPKPAAAAPARAAAPAPGTVAPEVEAWVADNPWFHANPAMGRSADNIHQAIVAENPNMPLAESLAETKRRIMLTFPEKFDNAARRAPSLVGRSSEPPARPASNGRGFSDMPRDSQEQFQRYSKMLAGKGKPLTKEEWAKSYWDQFVDV
jgi:hypothetical protein